MFTMLGGCGEPGELVGFDSAGVVVLPPVPVVGSVFDGAGFGLVATTLAAERPVLAPELPEPWLWFDVREVEAVVPEVFLAFFVCFAAAAVLCARRSLR